MEVVHMLTSGESTHRSWLYVKWALSTFSIRTVMSWRLLQMRLVSH